MTVPFFVTDHVTHKVVEVPYEILTYCDDATIDAHREDLRYLDCVYMNLGYYGNDPKLLKQMRDDFYKHPRPVFE